MHIARQRIRSAKTIEQEVWKRCILHTSRYYGHVFFVLNSLWNQRNTNDQNIQQYKPTNFSQALENMFVANSPFDAFRLKNKSELTQGERILFILSKRITAGDERIEGRLSDIA